MLLGVDIAKHLNQNGLLLQENLRVKLDLVKLMQIKKTTKDLPADSEFQVSQLLKFLVTDQKVTLQQQHIKDRDKLKI